MKLNRLLAIAGMISAICWNAADAWAQQGNFDLSNFDPAQFQQRIMDNYREQLEISDDAEWKVIQPRIQKVMDARREAGFGGGGLAGMARAFGRGGQRPGGQRAGAMAALGLGSNAEEEALQKAVDAKAPSADLKAALTKLLEVRKQKQANLEKAQAELRQVLSVRQEAIASLAGLL